MKSITTMILTFIVAPAYAHTGSGNLNSGASHAIIADSAVPLTKGQWSLAAVAERVEFDSLSDAQLITTSDSDPAPHSARSLTTTTLNLAYGLTENLTVGLAVPYVIWEDVREAGHDDHAHEGEGAGVERLGDASGVGDTTLFGLWRLTHRSQTDAHVAVFFGIKTPTGETRERARGAERFEAEFQPGSGSWDPFVGLAYSRPLGSWWLDVGTRYTVVTEGTQGTDLGDGFSYDIGASYRWVPARWDDLDVSLVVEINGEWRDRHERSGDADPNSGGHVTYLTPGISLGGARWRISAAVGVPVIDEPHGVQDERDPRLVFGIQWSP